MTSPVVTTTRFQIWVSPMNITPPQSSSLIQSNLHGHHHSSDLAHPKNHASFPSLIFHSVPLFFRQCGRRSISFDFQTLALSSLKFLGDAHLFNNTIRLTRDLLVPNSGAGRVLYNKPIRFRQPGNPAPASFSTYFSFSIANLNPDSIGGGMAFVISPDDESVGDAGGFLGIPAGGVGVEFDTVMDVEFRDVNGNHVGLDLGSVVSAEVADLDSVDVDLRSGDRVNSWVDYSGSTQQLNVSVSYGDTKPKSPVLSITINLNEYVDEFMFVGFSGSTQGSTEVHSLDWWSFGSSFDEPDAKPGPNPLPPPTAATFMNPTANAANSSSQPSTSSPPIESNSTDPTAHTTQKQSKCRNGLCKKGAGAVAGVVTASAFFLALCAILLIWVYTKKFKQSKNPIFSQPMVLPDTGDVVAVKRCSHSGDQGKAEFLSELSIIGTLRHRNLLRLQAYLHQECENQVIHRDVKASNIMLDESFNAKLGDFGLARQIDQNKSPDPTVAAGTMGYLAPEYLLTGRASEKTDVYSFGAVVLEVASGRRPIEKERIGVGVNGLKSSLVDWAWGLHRDNRLLAVADPVVRGVRGGGDAEGVVGRVGVFAPGPGGSTHNAECGSDACGRGCGAGGSEGKTVIKLQHFRFADELAR
ncbi:hypothetical protein OSB04_009546 [Centaurea solstitialis]|uniref:Protein kinase domain-containing protein n=1 Tax=Centaurea solstitialis TaxID=347529 RepID=A0AA38WB11_9ASTR|nr:hypothetical protein OSB04_009546 [Centaurea solstitialis]